MSRPRGARAAITALVTAVLALTAGPAAAHPFGDPQTVDVVGEGDTVGVVWRVGAPDDLTLLGIHLGLLPEDRVLLDGAIITEPEDAATLIAAEDDVEDYLLERVEVTVAGGACPGAATVVGDPTTTGVTLTFTCPGPVHRAEVRVRTLTDLHPAYRTLATGPDGQRAVYEQGANLHTFTLRGGDGDPSGASGAAGVDTDGTAAGPAEKSLAVSAVVQTGGVLAVLAVLVGLVLVARAARRRSVSGGRRARWRARPG